MRLSIENQAKTQKKSVDMETLYRRNDSRVWHICIMLCHVGLLTCPNKIEMLARDLSRKGNIIVKLNVWIIVTRCTDLGQI